MEKLNKITILFFIGVLLFLGCGPEPDPTKASYYRLKNETDIVLTLKFYYNQKTYLDSIILKPNEYSDEFRDCIGPLCDDDFFLYYNVDSLDIKSYKDNNILRRYKKNNNADKIKNPFDISFYNIHDSEYQGIYVYKIRIDDF